MHVYWQVRVTRQAGQIKSAIAMWRPDKFQEMNKRLMGIAADGKAKPLSKTQCLELVCPSVHSSCTHAPMHPLTPLCTHSWRLCGHVQHGDLRSYTRFSPCE